MRKMKGLTFFSMLFVMLAAIILGVLVIRIIPVYIENYTVAHSLDTLDTLSATDFTADPTQNEAIIKKSLFRQFNIDGIKDIKDSDIIIDSSNPDKFIVSIKYTVTRPLIGNISLLFDFDDSKEVAIANQ